MSAHRGRVLTLFLVVALAGCSSGNDDAPTERSVEASESPAASASASVSAAAFPIAAFADISEEPVSEEAAAEFKAALRDTADGGGMSATVMSADGTWSGAVGKADGVRDVRVDDQFGIASVTKSMIAAQVMQMVEAGELALDDLAVDHLPPDLDFDTNVATIRQLLGMHSGIPDWYGDEMEESVASDRRRLWKPADVLELVGPGRAPAGEEFEYSDTNYTLLGLVIEQVRGRPVADVLRDGVLGIDGIERLVYQPDEAPTKPMAMPDGESSAALEKGGGYLPSLADASSAGPAGAIASDSPSLARWWRAFCAGEIVSQDSLTEMTTFRDEYGLGLFDVADPYAQGVGHLGSNFGYVAWAGCVPEDGSVVVVLANSDVEEIWEMARPLVDALRSR
jgi:D-alanyl-D-alanine carboxypeptidase